MGDQLKNIMIGLFVTAATGIAIFMLMFLHPSIGNEGKTLHVRFTDIDKVTIGTRVTYAGKPVGEVIDIKEVETGRGGKADSSGHIYLYELTLRVDSSVNVFNTDEVSLRTSGLLGEKNIEITPIAPKPGQTLRSIDKEVIYAEETGTVEETFKVLKVVAGKFDKTLDAVTHTLHRVRDEKLVEHITGTMSNLESITGSLNKPDEWKDTLDHIHSISKKVNDTWPKVDKAVTAIDDAAHSARTFLNRGQVIVENVSQGQGTLGKFLVSDDFYLRINSITSKLETVFDDINHYGLLFHSDKGWQRLRARRLNLLQKLRSPQEFRNYFNDEIDQISTSLSRVSMVMNEISNHPCCESLMQNREFTKVFSELMRRVTMLEEEVRMYNTQVVEEQVYETELCPSVEQTNCYYKY